MSGRYHNKVPPFRPDPRHWTRKRRTWKQKKPYGSEDAAWEFLRLHPGLMSAGYTAYLCELCSKWHIGRVHNQKR